VDVRRKSTLRRWIGACLVVVVIVMLLTAAGIVALFFWLARAGVASSFNYDRIQPGMSREQVEALLGSAGTEVKSIPGVQPDMQAPGAPPGWTGVVWGDTYLYWESGPDQIWVGLSEGRVVSKHYTGT
jgi:hypothetical protein